MSRFNRLSAPLGTGRRENNLKITYVSVEYIVFGVAGINNGIPDDVKCKLSLY